MIETYKEFTFEAAHQVPPHSGLHGHTFKVGFLFRGEADPVFGWAENLDEVETALEALQDRIDHKYLNDIEGLEVPSLENIAKFVWHNMAADYPKLVRVTVSRGSDGRSEGCAYYGDDRVAA